jgi:four helix bundle protein
MENFGQFMYEKCLNFSVRMVNLSRYLQESKKEFAISKQVVRSATSIGANLAEAQFGTSKKDFLAKCYISLRETAETLYWLDVLLHAELITQQEYNSLYNDCEELKKLFVSITNSTKNNMKGPFPL